MTLTRSTSLFGCLAVVLLASVAEARIYLPREARFLSPDRAGMIDGPNQYAYVRNQPTMLTDPTGYLSYGAGSPQAGWRQAPSEDNDMMFRVEVEYAAEVAMVLMTAPRGRALMRSTCSATSISQTFNDGVAADLMLNTQIWLRVQSQQEKKDRIYPPAGEAGDPLGQRPYKIAVSMSYRGALPDFFVLDPVTRAIPRYPELGLRALERTLVHEWLHHFVRQGHVGPAKDFESDEIYSIARQIVP